jgi:hypothetical protein
MTYSGSMINDLVHSVELTEFRNNEALRTYLRSLAKKLLDRASEPTDPGLENKEFIHEMCRKQGLAEAVNLILEEIDELRRMSNEEYGS